MNLCFVSKNDSKPFKYNNSAFDTAGTKASMKENQNGILCDIKDCERDADPLASVMNDKDGFWNTPELECSMVVDDFAKADDNEVKDSVTRCTTPSKLELFEETAFYTDKNVMECELPELVICYKESTYHVVKDICIDEGVPSNSMDNILIERSKDEHKGQCMFVPSNGDENSDITKERVEIELLFPDGLKSSSEKDCDKDAANVCGTKEKVGIELLTPDGSESSSEIDYDKEASKQCCSEDASKQHCSEDSMQTDEANCTATGNIADVVWREKSMHNSMLLVQEFSGQKSLKSLLESSDYGVCEVKQVSDQISCVETILESPAGVSAAEESNKSNPASDIFYNSKVESGAITFDFNSYTPAASSRDRSPKNVDHEKTLESGNEPKHEDGISDSLSVSSQVQHGYGESSFSAAGAASGLITYSGPIAYSGSISLRSDSSTTSTRSFAFPVLQSEWNSSPVRMAKADRRHLRKHRGWRQGLLCCRF
uniref:18S pre-ribosomal assembly protein gar2-related n=1 Tax=Davidia involucrata TaxID=16924 RepID=A0A5B6ZT01_DAVIN